LFSSPDFEPLAAEIAAAERDIAAYPEAEANGRGAVGGAVAAFALVLIHIRHQLDILALVAALPVTSYIALHDLNLAAMFCDRLLILAGQNVTELSTTVGMTATAAADALRSCVTEAGAPHPEAAESCATASPRKRFINSCTGWALPMPSSPARSEAAVTRRTAIAALGELECRSGRQSARGVRSLPDSTVGPDRR
jgi:hypothetical protein